MEIMLSSPGVGPFIQQTARALYENSMLHCFATTFVSRADSRWQKYLSSSAKVFSIDLERQLQRRAITEIPLSYVRDYPHREILRTIGSKLDRDGRITDRLWAWATDGFDRWVADNHLDGVQGVYGYETACLETFRLAKERGLARIYELPAPEHDFVAKILEQEFELFPELRTPYYQHLQNSKNKITHHCRQEYELADLIIVNSQFTKNSYASAGLDVSKVKVLPLGAPAIASSVKKNTKIDRDCLHFLWAGSFSIRKGAHYLLSAWHQIKPTTATLKVFGSMGLPKKTLINLHSSIELSPTVPQTQLAKIYQESDLLIFPTLCDGFGMVITEALAHGLPVITTNCAGASDLVKHGINGLIVPARDTEALVEAINWCLTHPLQVREMRQAALETAAQWQWKDYRQSLVKNLKEGLDLMEYKL